MVKFRGVSVNIVSRHDLRKLPEYRSPGLVDTLQPNSIATCYVPSHPGREVWFAYSVQGPHPPNAQYLFKLLHNGHVFATWDCTAKYKYQGLTMYALELTSEQGQTGQATFQRHAFRFPAEMPTEVEPSDDCIEIRIHRIEHRLREDQEAFREGNIQPNGSR